MKKTMLVLSILAAFALTGCGGEQKSAPASKTPEAKPAVKVEEKQNQAQPQTTGKKEYKMGNTSKFGDYIGKKSSEPLHQFKTNNQ